MWITDPIKQQTGIAEYCYFYYLELKTCSTELVSIKMVSSQQAIANS